MGGIGRLFGGGPQYAQPVTELEGVVGAWAGARTSGGLSLVGGQVVVARDCVVFSPWDMTATREWLVKWLTRAGTPHVGTIDKLLSASKLLEPVVLPIGDITRVEVLGRASLFKPPQARVHLREGRHFDVAILHSPGTPNFSAKNNAALDEWLAALSVQAN